jgi:GntR family transcriptional repressor for pyruvate dehydrogenase complex
MAGRKNSETLYEQAVKYIENGIMTGLYKKGELLPSETELIRILGISRITVRKALGILARAGLIRTCRGRGSTVLFDITTLHGNKTLADYAKDYIRGFRSSTQIRLMLEPEIAREAAVRAVPEFIERLKSCLRASEGASSTYDSEKDFHRTIVEFMDNPELLKIYDNLISIENSRAPAGIISPENQKDIAVQLDQQHHKILGAIEKHDGEFAYFYMKEHTQFIRDVFEKHFEYIF